MVFSARLTRYRFLRTSCLIHEPLAAYAFEQLISALHVIHAPLDAIAVPEIKLGQIPMQMLLRAMLVNAFHAALEYGKETFDGIRMNRAINAGNIFPRAMVNRAVLREGQRERRIVRRVVGHYPRFLGDVSAQDRHNGCGLQVFDDHAARTASGTVNQRQNLMLLRVSGLRLRLGLVSADERFICLDHAALTSEWSKRALAHRFADTVRHKPCALERNAKRAVQLIRANALLARRDQEDRLQPETQGNVAGLEDRPDLDRERLAAVVALVRADARTFAIHRAVALDAAAMRADGAFRPDTRFDESVSGFFVVKVCGGKNRVTHTCSPCVRTV